MPISVLKDLPKEDFSGKNIGGDHERWREGLNIGRVVRFAAGIPKDPTIEYTVYEVQLNNIYGKLLKFRYIVPNSKGPHDLLKDLRNFYNTREKRWLVVGLKKVKGSFAIYTLKEIIEPHDVIEELSLQARGGRIKLHESESTPKLIT